MKWPGLWQLDREHLDAVEASLDALADLPLELLLLQPYICHECLPSQKMGPQAHFAEPVKMVSGV